MGSGDGGMESDWGVFVVESLGVVGVELTRERVFGRRAWMSCMDVKAPCCRRLDCGLTVNGHVRCFVGLVPVRSGAAMVTFRDGTLIPGDVGLCASRELGLSEIPDNGGVVNEPSNCLDG